MVPLSRADSHRQYLEALPLREGSALQPPHVTRAAGPLPSTLPQPPRCHFPDPNRRARLAPYLQVSPPDTILQLCPPLLAFTPRCVSPASITHPAGTPTALHLCRLHPKARLCRGCLSTAPQQVPSSPPTVGAHPTAGRVTGTRQGTRPCPRRCTPVLELTPSLEPTGKANPQQDLRPGAPEPLRAPLPPGPSPWCHVGSGEGDKQPSAVAPATRRCRSMQQDASWCSEMSLAIKSCCCLTCPRHGQRSPAPSPGWFWGLGHPGDPHPDTPLCRSDGQPLSKAQTLPAD